MDSETVVSDQVSLVKSGHPGSELTENESGAVSKFTIPADLKLDESFWAEINESLKCHGMQKLDAQGLISLPTATAFSVKIAITQLLKDNDRRHSIIQDLLASNEQTKEEARKQKELSVRCQKNLREMEKQLIKQKSKIKDLEESRTGEADTLAQKLQNLRDDHNSLRLKCQKLEVTNKNLANDLDRAARKLSSYLDKDEKRKMENERVFQEVKAQSSRGEKVSDRKILAVIDHYEAALERLRAKITSLVDKKGGCQDEGSNEDDSVRVSAPSDSHPDAALAHYKDLCRTLDSELKTCNRRLRDSENEKALIRLEVDSRLPVSSTDKERPLAPEDTSVDEIKYLNIETTRRYLKMFCDHLNVSDLNDVLPTLRVMGEKTHNYLKMKKFVQEVIEISADPSLPSNLTPGNKRESRRSYGTAIQSLNVWVAELKLLKNLYQSINHLISTLMPSQRILPLSDDLSVRDLCNYVDSITQENVREIGSDAASADVKTLRDIVRHFQNLFDVKSLPGVYPRMNDVYSRSQEYRNTIHTLKDLLGLETNCSTRTLIGAMEALCREFNNRTHDQLKSLLTEDDLGCVIDKVKVHDEFFPAFNDMAEEVMDVLGVDSLDRVVPAVRTLKLISRSS